MQIDFLLKRSILPFRLVESHAASSISCELKLFKALACNYLCDNAQLFTFMIA